MHPLQLGIDVAKAKLDCALRLASGKFRHKVVDNSPAGFKTLDDRLAKEGAAALQVCMEATGGRASGGPPGDDGERRQSFGAMVGAVGGAWLADRFRIRRVLVGLFLPLEMNFVVIAIPAVLAALAISLVDSRVSAAGE